MSERLEWVICCESDPSTEYDFRTRHEAVNAAVKNSFDANETWRVFRRKGPNDEYEETDIVNPFPLDAKS